MDWHTLAYIGDRRPQPPAPTVQPQRLDVVLVADTGWPTEVAKCLKKGKTGLPYRDNTRPLSP